MFSDLFADDTNLFMAGKNIHQLAEIMNSELINLSKWLKVNKFSLNMGITLYIFFSNKYKSIYKVLIKIDNQEIDQTTDTQFLGVIINSNFNWNRQLQHVCNEVSKCIGILSKVKGLLLKDTLITLYYILAFP